jgi:diguanylate cyclase (GGDEF)-like protein
MNPTDRTLIEQNALFSGMSPESFDYLLEHGVVRSLETGERLLQPDTENHHLHLILEGTLNVYMVAQETQEHITLQAGECVGEVSLIDGKYPSAIVVAAVTCRILSIPYDTVWSLINNSRTVAGNLLTLLASRLRNDNQTLADTQRSKRHFEHQASTDALTGVHNRHWMGHAFPRALQRCSYNKQPFAVMVVDIDHFKKINDTYGHLVGDLALKTVARCMAENLRPHDLLARYGGEEFAVLLTEADLDAARMVAERLRTKIAAAEIRTDDISFNVTLSIGITPTQHDDRLENLIHEADQALYRAKQMGRNRVEVYH